MTRRMSMEVMAAEEAAERAKPSINDAYMLAAHKECSGTKYTLLEDDLVFQNGHYVGKKISDVIKTVEGRDFVGRLWRVANVEMREAIRRHFSD